MAETDLGTPEFRLHPLHGMHEPTDQTPPRQRDSARRTTSIDMVRIDGTTDPLFLHGRGRDLLTGGDGSTTKVSCARFDATVDRASRLIRALDVDPAVADLSRLVGAPAMSGFRTALDDVAPQLRRRRDLLHTLLDDVPVATLISGHSLAASGILDPSTRAGYRPAADQCAGFVTGGLLMTSYQAGEPAIVTGPTAPDIDMHPDPHAWHAMPSLPTHGMRRRRRLDVSHDEGTATVRIDAMLRDTYVRGDGQETVIHEYTVAATLDADRGVIVQAEATPRVLPWRECPAAAASAQQIVGMTLDDLHLRVRNELTGTSTCTHLNDLLRSVADAQTLIEHL